MSRLCRLGLHRWVIRDAAALILGPAYFVRCDRCNKEAVHG